MNYTPAGVYSEKWAILLDPVYSKEKDTDPKDPYLLGMISFRLHGTGSGTDPNWYAFLAYPIRHDPVPKQERIHAYPCKRKAYRDLRIRSGETRGLNPDLYYHHTKFFAQREKFRCDTCTELHLLFFCAKDFAYLFLLLGLWSWKKTLFKIYYHSLPFKLSPSNCLRLLAILQKTFNYQAFPNSIYSTSDSSKVRIFYVSWHLARTIQASYSKTVFRVLRHLSVLYYELVHVV